MSNKPPPVNKTFGKSRSKSVNSQPNSTNLSLSNAPKASEGVYPFAVKPTSSILDCWGANTNPFAGREENGPNIARTATTSTSHEVRPIIATATEPRSRSTSASSNTNQFPPLPPPSSSSSSSSFVPTMTADQTEREQTLTKKRSMKSEANPPQKSRKNKSTQIDSVVQNGRRKHIEYLNEKINSYYKLMTHNELFYLYLSNEDTADGELLNWLEELGFTYTEKANVLQHDNLNDLQDAVKRNYDIGMTKMLNLTEKAPLMEKAPRPADKADNKPPSLSFTKYRCSNDDEDNVSQTPSSRHDGFGCPDSTRSYRNPSPSTELLVSGMGGLKVASKSPRPEPSVSRKRSGHFPFAEFSSTSSSGNSTSSSVSQSQKATEAMKVTQDIDDNIPKQQVDLLLYSQHPTNAAINDLLDIDKVDAPLVDDIPIDDAVIVDNDVAISDDDSVGTNCTEKTEIDEEIDEFATLNASPIHSRFKPHPTPDMSPKTESRTLQQQHMSKPPAHHPHPNAFKKSLTEPYFSKKSDSHQSPQILSQPVNNNTWATPIVHIPDNDNFRKSDPADPVVLERLRKKFAQRCEELKARCLYNGKRSSAFDDILPTKVFHRTNSVPANMENNNELNKLKMDPRERQSSSLISCSLVKENARFELAKGLLDTTVMSHCSTNSSSRPSLDADASAFLGNINGRRGGGEAGLSGSSCSWFPGGQSLMHDNSIASFDHHQHLIEHHQSSHPGSHNKSHQSWAGVHSFDDDGSLMHCISPPEFSRHSRSTGGEIMRGSCGPMFAAGNPHNGNTLGPALHQERGNGNAASDQSALLASRMKTRKRNQSYAKLKRMSLNFSSSFVLLSTSVASPHHADHSGVDMHIGPIGPDTDHSELSQTTSFESGNHSLQRLHHHQSHSQSHNHMQSEPSRNLFRQRKIQKRYSMAYRVCDEIVHNHPISEQSHDQDNVQEGDSSSGGVLDMENTILNLSVSHAYSYSMTSMKDSRRLSTIACEIFARFAMIVGGAFNYQFDNNVPVVSPPEMASIRVVNIELSGSGLILELWNPNEPSQQQQKNNRNNNKKKGKKLAASNTIVAAAVTKKVHLNSQWRWYHCSPIGYLVTDAWTSENQRNAHDAKKCVFYYLPKHPLKWHAFGDTSVVPTLAEGPSAMLSPVAPAAGDDSLHHIYHSEDHEEHLMNCDESSILDDENEVIDVDVDVEGVVNENHQLMEEDDVEEVHDHEAVMTEDPVMFTQVIAANSFEQDAVMEQDDDDEAVIPMECEEVQRLTMSHSSKLPKSLMFRIMSWLDNQEIRTGFVTLNKTWTMAAYWYLLAQGPPMISLSNSGNGDDDGQKPKNVISSKRFETFLSHYSQGKFLGDGACKRVYLIGGVGRNTFALSIMDINDLNLRGVQSAIEQELRISILCSNLSLMNVCPNMIRVFEVFQTNVDPSKIVWSCDPSAVVAKSSSNARRQKYEKGHFQFIRMEFCAGGDVESHLRKCHTFNADLIRSYLFQMCYSLYAGRESMSLRHYDIKLLNFFVTSGFEGLHVAKKYPEDSEEHHKEDSNNKGLQIGFGNHIYTLPIKLNQELSVIKLADFGTSVIGQEILNEPITPHQFTTLENTPPEFLMLGSTARQSHTADTFALGLCMVHMLTGEEPYEVLLKDVLCPKPLVNKLKKVWHVTEPHNDSSPYTVIKDVIDSLDEEADDDCPGAPPVKEVLAHTLYRYLVMFAASPDFASGFVENDLYKKNDVWNAINEVLDLQKFVCEFANGKYCIGGTARNIAVRKQFEDNVRKWSIHQGSSEQMTRARVTLNQLGSESDQLLNSLIHWDPSQRCSMYDALHHPIFHGFREDEKAVHSTIWSRYMYYHRNGETVDGLPIF